MLQLQSHPIPAVPPTVVEVLSDDERDALRAEESRACSAPRTRSSSRTTTPIPTSSGSAEETGGHVSDSLDMARFGREHPALDAGGRRGTVHGRDGQDLEPREARADAGPGSRVLAGPRVPPRRVRGLLQCPPRPHRRRLRQYQRGGEGALRLGRDVAHVRSTIVAHLAGQGEKILWAPDKYLGAYMQEKTEADMVLWNGACIVHEEFKALGSMR